MNTLKSTALSFALGSVALRSAASHARRRRRLVCRAVSRSVPLPRAGDACGAVPGDAVEAVAEALKGLPGQMGRALGGLQEDFEQAVQEALEFAEQADDGARPKLFSEADVVLVGPSRAGKTTITKLLAQKGLKVANYPLVPGEEPPSELLELDQRRVVKLTTQLEQLQQVRQQRMQRLGRQSSRYAATDAIRKELSWVKTFYIRNFPRSGPTIDTAKMSIAESMTMIAAQLTDAGIDVNSLSELAQSSSPLLS